MARLLKAVKWNMVKTVKSPGIEDLFRAARDSGFDGITVSAPGSYSVKDVFQARDKIDLPIHNINTGNHWATRLSDPDLATRKKALQNTLDAIQFASDVGASSILQVVGKATDETTENASHVGERSAEMLREALPLAARLGVRIACENVKNGFATSIEEWNAYLDQFHSPFLGAFFDIGNHDRFDGGAPAWIRGLGSKRIIKLDLKDHHHESEKNCGLFEGNVDWAGVRKAISEINYHGWVTAEVPGGDLEQLKTVARQMDEALGNEV